MTWEHLIFAAVDTKQVSLSVLQLMEPVAKRRKIERGDTIVGDLAAWEDAERAVQHAASFEACRAVATSILRLPEPIVLFLLELLDAPPFARCVLSR